YCNKHQRHCCKKEGCNSQIYSSKEYCSDHQSICKTPACYHERVRQLREQQGKLHEQKAIKENLLKELINRLLDAQKQSDQQVSLQIQLGMKEEECLTKKLGDEKIQTLCQTQIELTKSEKDLVKLEEIINLSLN
ncbi:28750_t:CDS:2, partial [Gigaspora margarita]